MKVGENFLIYSSPNLLKFLLGSFCYDTLLSTLHNLCNLFHEHNKSIGSFHETCNGKIFFVIFNVQFGLTRDSEREKFKY